MDFAGYGTKSRDISVQISFSVDARDKLKIISDLGQKGT
jgi:hypothetical protein